MKKLKTVEVPKTLSLLQDANWWAVYHYHGGEVIMLTVSQHEALKYCAEDDGLHIAEVLID